MGHLVWKVLEILAGRWEEARQLCWCKGAPERKDLDYESEGVAQNERGSGEATGGGQGPGQRTDSVTLLSVTSCFGERARACFLGQRCKAKPGK